MVADGEPGVVGEQRGVGAEELADVGGVVEGGVEVGVVFGGYGLVEDRSGGGEHERGYEALLVGVAARAGLDSDKEFGEALAESRPCCVANAHERVERGGRAGGLDVEREGGEEVVGLELVEVEDEGADAYA